MFLALDTSSAISAAVAELRDGDLRVLAESTTFDPRAHAELATPTVREVMDSAGLAGGDVTSIIVGVGPGPFTGLRVGITTARVLGATWGVPVHGVCSLDGLAAAARHASPEPLARGFIAATDARRREVYWAGYDANGRRVSGPDVQLPVDVAARDVPHVVVGRGGTVYAEAFTDWQRLEHPADPTAAGLLRAYAIGARADDTTPLYLRAPDATVPTPKP